MQQLTHNRRRNESNGCKKEEHTSCSSAHRTVVTMMGVRKRNAHQQRTQQGLYRGRTARIWEGRAPKTNKPLRRRMAGHDYMPPMRIHGHPSVKRAAVCLYVCPQCMIKASHPSCKTSCMQSVRAKLRKQSLILYSPTNKMRCAMGRTNEAVARGDDGVRPPSVALPSLQNMPLSAHAALAGLACTSKLRVACVCTCARWVKGQVCEVFCVRTFLPTSAMVNGCV
jgi:hypothetical protein